MRFSRAKVGLLTLSSAGLLMASVLPIVHLDQKTLDTYNEYVEKFDKEVANPYYDTGRMWMDSRSCCTKSTASLTTPMVEARMNGEIAGGSIHHFSGAMHIPGGTIEDVRHVMEDYANYAKIYKGDLSRAKGTLQPDSTPTDEHYQAEITITQNTIWMSVAYNSVYDTHYIRFSPDRWASTSYTISSREWHDPKNESAGLYPDRDDHGLLWRANTYWLVRKNGDGIDIQADSISLSRPIPTGFGWWGTKRSKDAVSKMLLDMKAAVDAIHHKS